jgi:uric acid transporter
LVLKSGISATAIVAVVPNLLFNEWKFGKRMGASVFAAAEDNRDRFGDRIDDDIEPGIFGRR